MASSIRIPTEFTAVDKFTSVVKKMTAGVSNFSKSTQSAFDRMQTKANNFGNKTAMVATAMTAPMVVAIKDAIDFEDKMADVAKTTGLNTEQSEKYGKAILDMSKSTRTSISALQDIGVVAGTIGVAKDELIAFTKAGNQFAIALGSDFGSTEFAVEQVAKLKNLFKETRDIKIAEAMTKAGSAINEVSNMAGSAKNINEFVLRMGQLPDAMKPTIQQATALGGVLEDAGLSAEIASGGFTNLILVAGKNMTGFASQMGMTVKSANELYKTDPMAFAVKFSKSVSKMQPRELSMALDQLKIGSQESIKVIGALASNQDKLTKATELSNKAFKEGTSLGKEATKKNETLAGKLDMAKNNMQALSIEVGTKLAPALSKLIPEITNLVNKVSDFVNQHPELIANLPYIIGGLWGISIASKAVAFSMGLASTAMFIFSVFQGVSFFLMGKSAMALRNNEIAMKAYKATLWLATGAQNALNLAMEMNPIGLIIIAIIAVIALVSVMIAKWDSWGASLTILLGPVGLVIGAFKSIYDHWESIKKAFKTEGIIGGFKRIGQVLFDAVLKPLQQMLELISKIDPTGLTDKALAGIKNLRTDMNLVTDGEKKAQKLESPQVKQAKATANATVNGQVNVNVSAQKGATAQTTSKSKGGIPVRLGNTQGAF